MLGIYSYVTVAPAEREGDRRFFNQFNDQKLRQNVVDGNLHITTQYKSELERAGLSLRESERMASVTSAILERTAKIDPIGLAFEIDTEEGIQGRERWWTLSVGEEYVGIFNDIRTAGASVVEENLGIKIATYSPDGYHISLTKRSGGHNRLKTRIPPPLQWVITGFGIETGVTSFVKREEQRTVRQRHRGPAGS